MRELIRVSHAFADETRWRLLCLLRDVPMCVCELADILEMPQSSVSSHLQIIRRADLLESERCGKWVYYLVAPAHRPFLRRIGETFRATPEEDPTLRSDALKAAARIARREDSCCPLPLRLAAAPTEEACRPS